MEWTGYKADKGYGMLDICGRKVRVHRFAWALANNSGVMPECFVLHKCDNPSCINPDHLELGDCYTNVADMVAKNRQAKGERIVQSKLTSKDVEYIRQHYRPKSRGGTSMLALAGYFRVSPGTIANAIRKIQWKHIEEETREILIVEIMCPISKVQSVIKQVASLSQTEVKVRIIKRKPCVKTKTKT